MILKVLAITFYIQSVMIAGCHSGQDNEASGDQLPVIVYNGNKVSLSKDQVNVLTNSINLLFNSCDDFYELIVTDNLIEDLKQELQYLEIAYPQEQKIDAGKFGNQKIKKLFIPLSGKFASFDQVTFFSGISDYSNTPFSNSKGSAELTKLFNEMIR